MSNIDKILEERKQSYGRFEDNAKVQMGIIREMQDGVCWGELSSEEQGSLIHIAGKIARIVTCPSKHKDNWDDIGGYSKLVSLSYEDDDTDEPTTL